MKWILCLLFIPTFVFATPAKVDLKYVRTQMKKAGFKSKFINDVVKAYEEKHFEQTLELNVLLYLRKHDDHGGQVSQDAVKTINDFMDKNRSALFRAEKDHGVSRSVISSLLWLESRHGVNQGRFHVASVYMHLLQGPRKSVVQHLREHAHEFMGKDEVLTPKIRAEIKKRTGTKAAWALVELKALQQTWEKDPELVRNLRGSFAGAFGMPQFIPSSYHRWARSTRKVKSPDLNVAEDAIQSVAFYLRDNGWRAAKEKSFVKALLKYNNSNDYARAILKLADEVDASNVKKTRRLPASI